MKKAPKGKRELILETALKHFADFGYEGAHVRKMLIEAGINTALAHYYFGSKEQLYNSVIQTFIEPVLSQRRANLAKWRQGDGTISIRTTELFAAYITPHFVQTSDFGGHDYARFMQRELSQKGAARYAWKEEVDSLRAEYRAALLGLFPNTSDDDLEFVMGALVAVMLAADTADNREGVRSKKKALELARRVAQLIVYGVAGLDKQMN